MARCLAFDKQTAQAISQKLHLLAICDPDADPLQSALQSAASTSLLVMPAAAQNRVVVAKFKRTPALSAIAEPPITDPIGFEATGFLGLTDQPVFETAAEPAKRWWQKMLE